MQPVLLRLVVMEIVLMVHAGKRAFSVYEYFVSFIFKCGFKICRLNTVPLQWSHV